MATNFEFYKDEISEITREGQRLAMVEGKLRSCAGLDCDDCDFGYGCIQKTFEWLYAEHIEQPKLTKRERAFCVVMNRGHIVKNKDGEVFYSADRLEPWKRSDGTWSMNSRLELSAVGLFFNYVKWEDEKPWSVEGLLKLDVMHEVQ